MRGPWTSNGCGIYRAVGEDVFGEYLASAACEGDAAAIANRLNEQQRAIPERRVRAKRPKAKRDTVRRSGRRHDREYMLRVKELPCVVASWTDAGSCAPGGCEANHVGERGLSQKSHDDETVPMCRGHHRDWTDHAGVFSDMPKAERREWAKSWIATTRATLGWTQERRAA
jgi:hypothetical protein